MTPAPVSPQCASHPRAAVATCVRCGSFLCGECTELLGEAAYCAACVQFVQKHSAASRGLKLALGLDLLSAPTWPLVLGLVWWLEDAVPSASARLAIAYSLVLGWGLPVLHGLAVGVGLALAARELRRPDLSFSARRLARWTRGLALLSLGYFLLELAPIVWGRLVGHS